MIERERFSRPAHPVISVHLHLSHKGPFEQPYYGEISKIIAKYSNSETEVLSNKEIVMERSSLKFLEFLLNSNYAILSNLLLV